jgi:hypothetical protein
MRFFLERRTVQVTGEASLGWIIGQGYVKSKMTVFSEKWCVIDGELKGGRPLAICNSEKRAKLIVAALNESEARK